jgi:hypothetical protein
MKDNIGWYITFVVLGIAWYGLLEMLLHGIEMTYKELVFTLIAKRKKYKSRYYDSIADDWCS